MNIYIYIYNMYMYIYIALIIFLKNGSPHYPIFPIYPIFILPLQKKKVIGRNNLYSLTYL